MSAAPATNDALLAAQLTEQYDKATGGMIEVLKFGAMMIALEQTLSARGQGSGNGIKGDGVKGWLTQHAPKVNRATAYRLKAVTESVATDYEQIVGAKMAKQFTLPALVTTPADELPAPAAAKQLALFDYVRGTSQRSWLDRVLERHGHAIRKGNGGFHPNALILRAWLAENYAEQPELQEMDFCDLPKDVQARFKKEGQRYEERLSKEQKAELELAEKARGWNGGLAASLLDAIAEGFYARATDEELAAQRDALKDYLGKLDDQLTARAGKRGKKQLAKS